MSVFEGINDLLNNGSDCTPSYAEFLLQSPRDQTTDHHSIYLAGDAQEKAKSDHIQEYVIINT